jgi:hypothetical protein
MNKLGLLGLVLVIVVTLGNLYWTSTQVKKEAGQAKQEVWVDTLGRVHTLGLTLDKTTLREAELALKSLSDPALYLYPDREKKDQYSLSLEAYFPSIADHSKVVLGLYASDELLLQIRSRATAPRLNQNGVGRMNVSSSDNNLIQNLRVMWMKFIPSVQLQLEHIKARFGAPEQTIAGPKGISLLLYPKLGLHVLIRDEGKDVLTFTLLSAFAETTTKIMEEEKILLAATK